MIPKDSIEPVNHLERGVFKMFQTNLSTKIAYFLARPIKIAYTPSQICLIENALFII